MTIKINFKNILISNIFIFSFIYIFLFILYPSNSSYFTCNELVESKFLNSQISYFIPVSCDLELYLTGVYDLQSIYQFDYNYQSRPLYILFIKIIYELLRLIILNNLILKFLTFAIAHLIIISFSFKLFVDTLQKLEIKLDKKKFFLLLTFFSLFPIIKWGVFDASHQTLTFLQFSISFYFLAHKFEKFKTIYFLSFILGILALSNMTFALPLLFLVFHKLNSINKVINNFVHLSITFIIFIVPLLSWNLFIRSQGFIPYNAATTYWYQFIWLKDFILAGYENINFNPEGSEYFCMSVPLFLKCYLTDFLNTLLYISVLPSLCLIIYRHIEPKNKKIFISSVKNLFFIFLISFVFWSFIGWYPPLRFNLYSIGSFFVFLFCIQYLLVTNFRIKYISGLIYISYFISLNHWNYLEVVRFNFGLIISLLLLLYLLIISFTKNEKMKS